MTIPLLLPLLAIVALVLSAGTVPFIRRLATNTGLVDDPRAGEYKTHSQATPYGGGICIAIGVMLPSIAALWWIIAVRPFLLWDGGHLLTPWSGQTLFPLEPLSPTIEQLSQTVALLLAAFVVFCVGLADDWRRLSAGIRLFLQGCAALLLIAYVPGFRPEITRIVLVDAMIAIVWLVALTNAFNFLDNMNGLSAGVGAIAIAALSSLALASAHLPAAALGLLVVGATGGFLRYNFPRASIFMGDAGGLFLGFVSGALALLISNRLNELAGSTGFTTPGLLPLLCLSIPCYDLVSVVILRLHRRLPPWQGDTNHISHRLVQRGLSHVDAVVVIFLATALTCAVVVVAFVRPTLVAWSIVAIVGSILCIGLLDIFTRSALPKSGPGTA
jgi:UDP-GlcNAc:undecaprenyl-phosphate GlcNAc-1-phosphate transferase